MENDTLKKIQAEYSDMLKIAQKDYSEIEELAKDPNVQRYLYLRSLADSRDLIEDGKIGALDRIIRDYGINTIKETNNILCYLYELKNGVLVYLDLEDKAKAYAINKEEKEEFERTHKVVYGDTSILDCMGRYYNTRYKFFEDCINEGQETAVEKLLSREKQRIR